AGVIFIAEVALAMFLRPGCCISTGLALLGRSTFWRERRCRVIVTGIGLFLRFAGFFLLLFGFSLGASTRVTSII
ncbi:hypothetical protein Q4595_29835, partial [Wenyingzhuangia sp. 1_MG-2023]|nr:hypothetical protein [Wenyingzhuangia sp. 1_MG-2023]